jgi:hypothetical protein
MNHREHVVPLFFPAVVVARVNWIAILEINWGKHWLGLEFGFNQSRAPVFEQFGRYASSSELCATPFAVEDLGV